MSNGVMIPTPEALAEVSKLLSVCTQVSEDDLGDFKTLLKPENDPRTWGLKAELQNRNDCQANACTSAMEVVEYRSKSKRGELSRMFCYQQCEVIDGWLGRDCGTTTAAGARLAKTIGCPLESEYPYTRYTGRRAQLDAWSSPLMESAASRKIAGIAPLQPWATMLAHAALGHPTHWATHWSLPFSREPETGHLLASTYSGHGRFGHAHTIVWAMQLRSGQWVALDWNSHGDQFFLITEEFYEEARNPRVNPYGGYVFLGEDKPIETFYNGQFDIMK